MHAGKVVTTALGLLAAGAVSRIYQETAGPDPAKWLLHESGFWGLIFLLLTLAVSPASRIVRMPRWVSWRRPLGLAAFFVVTVHVLVYATAYQGFDWNRIVEEIGRRRYILLGLLAWVLLIPLAATSTRNARVRLGSAWKKLHRLVYVVLPITVAHQGMAQKADLSLTVIFSAILAVFFLERAANARR